MRKGAWSGQMNLFEFMSDASSMEGPVEMVSLMPEESVESKQDIVGQKKKPVMSKIKGTKEVSYYDYNRIFVKKDAKDGGKFYEFSSSQEAVDFYFEQIMGD